MVEWMKPDMDRNLYVQKRWVPYHSIGKPKSFNRRLLGHAKWMGLHAELIECARSTRDRGMGDAAEAQPARAYYSMGKSDLY